jgi:uncharacterized protein (DUF362 family)
LHISRREFIRRLAVISFATALTGKLLAFLGCSPVEKGELTPSTLKPSPEAVPLAPPAAISALPPAAVPAPPSVVAAPDTYLAVVRGNNPSDMVETAIKALGGIERFVKPGDDVIIKPNICVAYHSYEYAATTNPEVVGTIVKLCVGAGARRVRVMDQPFGGTPEQAYVRSGIDAAVKSAGGTMEVMSRVKFRDTPIPDGKDITRWQVYGDVLDADVLIDVPIAKHHSLARLTLGMKNLMGVILNRGQFHSNLGQRIADLTSLRKPDLTIVDGVRILMNHGPSGGDLNDVKLANTIIASRDIVAADAYAATLFGLTGEDIPAIRAGAQMGLGTADLKSVKIEELVV